MISVQQISMINGIPKEPAALTLSERHRLWEASKGLEAEFARYLLSQMNTSIPGVKTMAGGDIYQDMFRESMAATLAESQSLGLARQLYQEGANLAVKTAQARHAVKTDEIPK